MLQRKKEGERWIKVGAVARESKCKTEKLSSYLSDYLLPQHSCLLLLLLPWWWPTLDHNRTVFLSDALKQAWALWNQIGYVYFSKVVRIFISPTFTWNRWFFFHDSPSFTETWWRWETPATALPFKNKEIQPRPVSGATGTQSDQQTTRN